MNMNSPEIPHKPPHHEIVEQAIKALGDKDPTSKQLLEALLRASVRTAITALEQAALLAGGVSEEVLKAHFTLQPMLTKPAEEEVKSSEPSFN